MEFSLSFSLSLVDAQCLNLPVGLLRLSSLLFLRVCARNGAPVCVFFFENIFLPRYRVVTEFFVAGCPWGGGVDRCRPSFSSTTTTSINTHDTFVALGVLFGSSFRFFFFVSVFFLGLSVLLRLLRGPCGRQVGQSRTLFSCVWLWRFPLPSSSRHLPSGPALSLR